MLFSQWDVEAQLMNLSVCYITKNEEKNIEKSLASIKAAADEIVVVDTGSRDKTKAIAASYGAKVYDYEWRDDFSQRATMPSNWRRAIISCLWMRMNTWRQTPAVICDGCWNGTRRMRHCS